MKITTTLASILILSISSLGQKPGKLDYFLNSKKIDFSKTYLNPTNIDSIRITGEGNNKTAHIYTTNKSRPLLTLTEILKKYTDIKKIDSSILFRINNQYIYDIDGIEIDKSFFIHVNVSDASKAHCLSDRYKDVKIIEIDLEKEKRKPEIWISGKQKIAQTMNKW